MTNPADSSVQNLLPVQAYFNAQGQFQTFIGQGQPFYATANPSQSGLNITSSTINSTTIGATTPSSGVFTSIATTTGTISTAPTGATDIANKQYVDYYAAGLSWKQPALTATSANITLSGLQTINGVTVVVGDTVLVKNQTTSSQNGIYVASAGAWTYSPGGDTWSEYVGAIIFITNGSLAGTAWYCTAQPGGTLGTTAMTWSNFSVASSYTAGTGLTLTGTQFSITPVGTAGTYGSATQAPVFITNASGQVSSVTNTTITPAVGSITGLGTGVATALAINTGSAGAFVVNGGALGTPSSGTVTNLTGTASISINGTVGATTANTGAFTVLSTSSTTSTTPVLGFNAANAPIAMGATISGSYLQAMLQNKSGTAGASTNYVLSNDLGTDSTYYGEFGMNSSVFSASTPADFFSLNNGVYFSAHDGDVSVGSGNGGKHYLVWGTTGQSAHVINVSGAIGLNTNLGTTPALSGTTNFGTSGQVLTSAGSAATPTWTTPSPMVYPGAGIPNSTGTAWGTSYTTTGSGNVVLDTRPTMSVTGSGFTLQDATDNTKQANFDLSGITTATTRTLTLPNTTGTLAALNLAQTFTATQTFTGGITTSAGTLNFQGSTVSVTSLGTAATTGTTTVGGTSQTGTLIFGRSTVSQQTDIQAGATASGSTKTINLGTGGLTGSTTSIAIGSTFGTTITLNGTVNGTISTATNATNTAITDDTTTATTCYPTWVTTTTGNLPQKTASTKLSFVPSTGVLSATTFSGSGASLTSIPNSALTNSTISGVSLGSNLSALTAGTGLTATATYNGSAAITFNATGTTINSQTSAYVLVAGDAGKTISITTGGVTVNNSVMSAGNIVSIYNNSGSSQTITQGTGVTLQWAGQSSSSTGNRTLGLYGLATLVYISASNVVITGSGLT